MALLLSSSLEPFLKIGVILANFKLSGKLPLEKGSLTRNARGSDKLYKSLKVLKF